MLTPINPKSIAAPGPYSHGIKAEGIGSVLFVSGQVGIKPDGSVAEGIGQQTKTAFQNLLAVLADSGMTAGNIAKLTIYLTDEANLPGFLPAGGPFLPNPPPAITLVYVKALARPALLVEVDAIAVR